MMRLSYPSRVLTRRAGKSSGLLVIGATNVPERIDAALLRPGRFDRVLFVDLPQESDRLAILEIHARGMPLEADVDLGEIARKSPFCSGAELEVHLAAPPLVRMARHDD